MKAILRPRQFDTHGQDYRASLAIQKLALAPICLYKKDCQFQFHALPYQLIINFDPQNAMCKRFISQLNEFGHQHIPIVSHFQHQLSYLTKEELQNLAYIFKVSNKIVVPAVFLKQSIVAYFSSSALNSKVVVIPNGANKTTFYPVLCHKRQFYKTNQLKIAHHQKLVVFVGALTQAKGLQILLALYKNFPKDCHLFIFCKETTENKKAINILKTINSQQIFIEFDKETCPNNSHSNTTNRLNHPVKHADILISTSLSEVAPMVVLEALLAGVPVIATHSTPFFDEIASEVALKQHLHIIKMPARLSLLSIESRCLTPNELHDVVTSFLFNINQTIIHPYSNRLKLHERLIAKGLESTQMIKKYDELYQTVSYQI